MHIIMSRNKCMCMKERKRGRDSIEFPPGAFSGRQPGRPDFGSVPWEGEISRHGRFAQPGLRLVKDWTGTGDDHIFGTGHRLDWAGSDTTLTSIDSIRRLPGSPLRVPSRVGGHPRQRRVL